MPHPEVASIAPTFVAFDVPLGPICTSTAAVRMFVQIVGIFAEFKRSVIVEHTVGDKCEKAARGGHAGAKPPPSATLQSTAAAH